MQRRDFLQYGLRGLSVIAAHPLLAAPFGCGSVVTTRTASSFELRIVEALVEMVDKTVT